MNCTSCGRRVDSTGGLIDGVCDSCRRRQPTGWICPKCGAANAPSVKRCNCPNAEKSAHEQGERFGKVLP